MLWTGRAVNGYLLLRLKALAMRDLEIGTG